MIKLKELNAVLAYLNSLKKSKDGVATSSEAWEIAPTTEVDESIVEMIWYENKQNQTKAVKKLIGNLYIIKVPNTSKTLNIDTLCEWLIMFSSHRS